MNAVLNDTLDKETTHNFTQANTQIVSPDQHAIPTQTFLSCFKSESQKIIPKFSILNQS